MDPFISGLLLSIVTNLATGPINVVDLSKNLINKLKADPRPINHDLQKAIKIAYLQALLEITQEFKAGRIESFRLYLPTELDQKIKQWQTELKQVENAKDETEISSPLQDTAEIEQLLLSHGKPIGDRLQELETRLISQALQGIADIPADYQNQVQTGLFARIYAHFVEQLKTNDRAYRAFELEYLPAINASLTEIGVGQEQVALTMTDMLSVVNRTDQNVQKIIDILNPKSLTLEDWQEICRQNLALQKQLTTNPFTNAYGVAPQLDQIYVPLAIVESKPPKPPSRNQPEEKEEEKLIPIAEECFFEDVLRQGKSQISQGRKIAIIGEPGSGKTTRLQKIADWILEQDLGLPIWISLADLTQPTVSQYIEEIWLKQTGQNLTIDELTQQKERIWLLLDGLDEMTSRVERCHVSALLGGWVQAARVVVTCRVNVWEADKNAFSGFDVFRNLEFNPEQVTDYIRRWFAAMGDAATGESLEAALAKSEDFRLKELIQNPLRLWMLCQIWQTGGGLPETQIEELFPKFVEWQNSLNFEDWQNWQNINISEPKIAEEVLRQDWGDAPEVRNFFGRIEELATLEQWILQDKCRLLAIVGMGGIGKTDLSIKLGKGVVNTVDSSLQSLPGIQEKFDYVIWRSLLNAPSITEILSGLIKFLSNQKEIDLPENIDNQISRLLHYFREHRCLVILDNAEAILQECKGTGTYRQGYEPYGQLFNKVGEVTHQSCLLLTSREKPENIDRLAGDRNPVRIWELIDLDYQEGRKIIEEKAKGYFYGSEEEWKKLINFYRGNPLALKLATSYIIDISGGNISDFLQQENHIFGDRLENDGQDERHNMRRLLDWHFNRCSKREKEILYWIAINREAVSKLEIRDDIIATNARREFYTTLQSLQRKLLIQTVTDNNLSLQPVLIEYMTDRLIENAVNEILLSNPGFVDYRIVIPEQEEQNRKDSGIKIIEVLNNHALLKALSKDYVRDIQIRLIINPIIERLIEYLGSQGKLEEKLKLIITLLQNDFSKNSGYAATNIFHILCQAKSDLSRYDFSNLKICQAYFQGLTLQNVNFAHAEITKSVFTQTFGSIFSVAFSPDEKKLAAGDGNGRIYLWEMDSWQQILVQKIHDEVIWSVTFSPNGERVMTGSSDGKVKIWDIKTNQLIKILENYNYPIFSVAVNCDGKLLARGSSDGTIKVWDINTEECLYTFEEHTAHVWSVNFSSNGKLLASGSNDQTVKIWDIEKGLCIKTLKDHKQPVFSASFDPSSTLLASGSSDKTVKIWDIERGLCIRTLSGHTDHIWSVSFSADGRFLASGSSDKTVRIWDTQTGECINTLQGHTNSVLATTFSPTIELLATGSYDNQIRLWQNLRRSSECLKTLQGYTNWVRVIAFSPNNETLASGNSDNTIKLWNIKKASFIKNLTVISPVLSISFSADGQFIICSSYSLVIKVLDVETGKVVRYLKGHEKEVYAVTCSSNGKIIASGSDDQTVRLWNVDSGECLKVLEGHTNWVRSVTFTPNGKIIASGSDDQTVRLWDIDSGECLKVLKGHTNWVRSVAFTPNGKIIASGSDDQTVRLWDVDSGECLKVLKGHTNWVRSVAFTPNGKIIASGSNDQTVRLLTIENGQLLKELKGHSNSIESVAFSADGKILATGSRDDTIKLWEMEKYECINTLIYRPYEGMNITGVTGINETQKESLKILGAVESEE